MTVALRAFSLLLMGLGLALFGMSFTAGFDASRNALIAGSVLIGAGLQLMLISDVRHAREYLAAIYKLQRLRR